MSSLKLPSAPGSLKPVAHLLKTASEHENRDAVVTFWCRLASLQTGMKLDRSSKEALAVLLPLMDWRPISTCVALNPHSLYFSWRRKRKC
jgi:vacuolar protein sorting-associated protein VTA1